MTARWRLRGQRLCPRRRPWASAAIADASAALGSTAAAYQRLDERQRQHEDAVKALGARRRRDVERGLYALDGHLHADAAFRRFVAERSGLRPPTPTEAVASWPEPEAG